MLLCGDSKGVVLQCYVFRYFSIFTIPTTKPPTMSTTISKVFYAPGYTDPLNVSLLLLRVAGAGFMLTHGYGKLEKVMSGNLQFGDPIGIGEPASLYLAVFAEFFCALLVLFGLLARWAAIPLIVTMLVAVFIVHAGQEFGNMEPGLFFMICNLVILLCGPGKYSLDYMIRRRR
jgi:putative oxidoreductase